MPAPLSNSYPDRPEPSGGPRRARRRPGRRRRAGATLAMVLVLAGCGLRLETDPPAPLVPDAAEEARQRTVADALALATMALAAAPVDEPDAGPDDEATTAEPTALLSLGAAAAEEHVAALGGVYDPGTDEADDETGADPGTDGRDSDDQTSDDPDAAATGAPPTIEDVVDLLRDAAATSRADALTVEDGGFARLLASVSIHRTVLADRLGAPATADEPSAESDDTVADDRTGTEDEGNDGDVADDGNAEDGGDGGDAADDTSAAASPADRDTMIALIRAQDAAGQAWEVAAARADDDARAEASARAATHRDAAEQWAEVAGLVGPDDQRLAEYALAPGLLDGITTGQVLAETERDLAARYLALVAADGAGTGDRARLLDAAADCTAAAFALDGVLEPLPGMPEQRP